MRLTWTLPTALVLTMPLAAGAQSSGQSSQPPQEQQQGQSPQHQQSGDSAQAHPVEVDEIVDNPTAYYGKRVTVAGEVDDVIGSRTFSIGEEGVLDIDDSLLVVTQQGQTMTDDRTVKVTGTVRELGATEIERDYGITDWDADGFFTTADERRPVLVAEAIDIRQ